MKYIVQNRRGTAAQWADSTIIPLAGELVVEIDDVNNLHKLKIGDGEHPYSELAYLKAGDEIVTQVLAQAMPRVVTVTLAADKWEKVTCETNPNLGYYVQEINIEDITEKSRLDLQPNADMLAEFKLLDLVFVTENEGGNIMVYSVGSQPTKSYTMQATIIETDVVAESEKIVGIPVGAPASPLVPHRPIYVNRNYATIREDIRLGANDNNYWSTLDDTYYAFLVSDFNRKAVVGDKFGATCSSLDGYVFNISAQVIKVDGGNVYFKIIDKNLNEGDDFVVLHNPDKIVSKTGDTMTGDLVFDSDSGNVTISPYEILVKGHDGVDASITSGVFGILSPRDNTYYTINGIHHAQRELNFPEPNENGDDETLAVRSDLDSKVDKVTTAYGEQKHRIYAVGTNGEQYVLVTTDNTNQIPTTTYVDKKVADIVNSAPETLDTLNELAEALGDDPNFATTMATELGKKADKATTLAGYGITDAVSLSARNIYTGTNRFLGTFHLETPLVFGQDEAGITCYEDMNIYNEAHGIQLNGYAASDYGGASVYVGREVKLRSDDGLGLDISDVIDMNTTVYAPQFIEDGTPLSKKYLQKTKLTLAELQAGLASGEYDGCLIQLFAFAEDSSYDRFVKHTPVVMPNNGVIDVTANTSSMNDNGEFTTEEYRLFISDAEVDFTVDINTINFNSLSNGVYNTGGNLEVTDEDLLFYVIK